MICGKRARCALRRQVRHVEVDLVAVESFDLSLHDGGRATIRGLANSARSS